VAKLILDNDQVAEDFFEHARLFGIQCPVSPHKFVWLINNHFGYDFRLQTDTDITVDKKTKEIQFSTLRIQRTIFGQRGILSIPTNRTVSIYYLN
jgi:hypothetical protein